MTPDGRILKGGPTRSAQIRARLEHPVVDADGHAIEFGPVYLDYLKQVAGPDITERFLAVLEKGGWFRMTPEDRRRKRVARPSSWTLPTLNTLDRATAMLPKLFRERMDEFGLDFSVVYSTLALNITRLADEELRRATCRALNVMFADIYSDQADRMTPVAAIPAHTPDEAIAELDHSIIELRLKAAMINSNVRRPIEAIADLNLDFTRDASWMDTLCMESPYDYDPLWTRCTELGVAVTSHAPSVGWGSRVVSYHYIHNHVGSFAASGEAFAKAVVLSGVSKRFPTLNFAFLEGGVAWASELGIETAEDLRPLFEPNFYFGCEADDPLVALGFDRRMNPFGSRLKAMFSSDIGHWDVPDMTRVLEEAYELVEKELLDEEEFGEFTFVHPAMLHAGMNADFFKDTIVEDAVAKLLEHAVFVERE